MQTLFIFRSRAPLVRRSIAVSAWVALPWLLIGRPAAAQSSSRPVSDVSAAPSDSRASVPSAAALTAPGCTPGDGGSQETLPPSTARKPASTPWYEVGFQTTLIGQNLFKFRSPYAGKNSLRSRGELKETDSYTLFLGVRPARAFELYVNPEWVRGKGIGGGAGLAGYTNGEVLRAGVKPEPVLARYFGRWIVPTGRGTESVEAGENKIPGPLPAHRLVLTAGKIAVTDLFDVNSYANSTRTQFMNWALINNAAYDFAADTRGYSRGVALEWLHPGGAVRLGSFQMPTVANGIKLAGDLIHNRGDQMEVELHLRLLGGKQMPAVFRLLGYRNLAHMGRYRAALALARQTGTTPDITAVEKKGAVKYGFGLNFEQALGDDGNTGVFGRWGWNDGRTESFAFTECDRTFCLGGQLSGARWHRPQDRWALALVQNELSAAHRDYLAAGGSGFQLGDGRLRYGPEQILETYYSYRLTSRATLSPDYQFINHPGYNRDRGPVSVFSFRVHWEF